MNVKKIAKRVVLGHFIITVRSAVCMTLWRDPFLQGRIDAAIKWNAYQRKRGTRMDIDLLYDFAIDIILLIAAIAAFGSTLAVVWVMPDPLNILFMTWFLGIVGFMGKEVFLDVKDIVKGKEK